MNRKLEVTFTDDNVKSEIEHENLTPPEIEAVIEIVFDSGDLEMHISQVFSDEVSSALEYVQRTA